METIFGGFDITTMILLFGIWGILYNQGKIAKGFDDNQQVELVNNIREIQHEVIEKLDDIERELETNNASLQASMTDIILRIDNK